MDCSYYRERICRSCSLLPQTYEESWRKKDRDIRNFISGALPPLSAVWRPFVSLSQAEASRYKVKMAVRGTVEEPLLTIPSQLDRGVPHCPLHPPKLNRLLEVVRRLLIEANVSPYDLSTRRGEIKGVIVVANEDLSQIVLRFVLRSTESIQRIRKRLGEVTEIFPEVRVVSANILPEHVALVEGRQEELLTDASTIEVRYNDFAILIGPQSFIQVTHEAASLLYGRVAEYGKGVKGGFQLVFDLFCGSGGFSFAVRKSAHKGIGVELSQNSINCAMAGRKINNAAHLHFVAGDVEEYLSSYSGEYPDCVIVNPPRRGLSSTVLDGILRLRPAHLIYSSCNPETFVSNVQRLLPLYEPVEITAYDMFPFTRHSEVLGIFRLLNSRVG